MKQFSGEHTIHTEASTAVLRALLSEGQHAAYIGLDVHKDTIAVAVAWPGRGAAQSLGEVANTPKAVAKLVARLSRETGGAVMQWCYEAGPCGYGLYRQLLGLGQECQVVAPSRVVRAPGERIKTDRRDALKQEVIRVHAEKGQAGRRRAVDQARTGAACATCDPKRAASDCLEGVVKHRARYRSVRPHRHCELE